jgi:hypothetical protein
MKFFNRGVIMKKYLLAASFLVTISTVNASLQEGAAEQHRAQVRAEPTIDLTPVINSFRNDQQNYAVQGRTFGGFGGVNALKPDAIDVTLLPAVQAALQKYKTDQREFFQAQLEEKDRQHAAALQKQKEENAAALKKQQDDNAATNTAAREVLQNMSGISKALTEAQEERDQLKQRLQTTEGELTAAQGRATVLKQKEDTLLLESDKKDAAAALEAARKRLLQDENTTLKRLVAEIAANAAEEGKLLRENDDNASSLNIQTGSTEEIEAAKAQILGVIESNKAKIQQLQAAKATLEKSKEETEVKVKKLEKAIEENDYYTQISNMIMNRDVSDDDLALFINSVKTIVGNLDELSEGRDERLVVKLIHVSLPYGPRPEKYAPCFEGNKRFRTLGNLFTPRGLAWVGVALDLNECHHAGSKFDTKSSKIASYAKKLMSTSEEVKRNKK